MRVPVDEPGLIEGLRAGRAEAADELIDRFAGPLSRYFAVHLPDASLADDMTQEAFLRFIAAIRKGAGPVKSAYSLLFTIARNLAIDSQRARGRRPRWESLDAESSEGAGPVVAHVASGDPDPRQRAMREQERVQLEEALRQLPVQFREVVVMRHIEGLGGQEIAGILGVNEGTVWSRLGRGLAQLRGILESHAGDAKGAK